MNQRSCIFLFILGFLVSLIVAGYQSVPGYMDDAYYYLGGLQLVRGEGFSEPIIWNYLDNPQDIPHPSHGYWMPLASIVAAAGMALTGNHEFNSARVGFLVLAALVPVVTAKISFQLSGRKSWSWISGLLAVFSGFYLPYVTTTDNFTIYLLFGGILFLLLPITTEKKSWTLLLLGVVSGIFHLSRSDGVLWLPTLSLMVVYAQYNNGVNIKKILLKQNFLL